MKILSYKNLLYILSLLGIYIYFIYFYQLNVENTDIGANEFSCVTSSSAEDKISPILDKYGIDKSQNQYAVPLLQDTNSVVTEYNMSNVSKIEPNTTYPIIDLTKSQSMSFEIEGKNKIEIRYEKPKEYTTQLMYKYLSAKVFFKDKEVGNIMIKEQGDFKGLIQLQIYNNPYLKYPLVIMGMEFLSSSKNEIAFYYLKDSKLVQYRINIDNKISQTVNSTLEPEIYIEKDSSLVYINTYIENTQIMETAISQWVINHNTQLLEKRVVCKR
jgi:hypothetical protein